MTSVRSLRPKCYSPLHQSIVILKLCYLPLYYFYNFYPQEMTFIRLIQYPAKLHLSMPPFRFLLIYGSQTGQSEAISEQIALSCGEDLQCDLKVAEGLTGDTNYTDYGGFPNSLNRFLTERGAKSFYEYQLADDAVGLEHTVEPWIEGLWDPLRAVLSPPSLADKLAALSITTTEPDNITTKLIYSLEWSGEKEWSHTFPHGVDKFILPFSDGTPLEPAPVLSVTPLTSDPLVKSVLEIEIACTAAKYGPGDSFGVLCENSDGEVTTLLSRLSLSPHTPYQLQVGEGVKARLLPKHILMECTPWQSLIHSVSGIKFVFNIITNIRDSTSLTSPLPGVCSTYLSSLSTTSHLHIYRRKNNSFLPPSSPGSNMILIGAGTGVSPFLGFLDNVTGPCSHVTEGVDHVTEGVDRVTEGVDRVTEGVDHVTEGVDHVTEGVDHVTTSHVTLITGNRYRALDSVYDKEFEEHLSCERLNTWYRAFSREEGSQWRYVQDVVRDKGEEMVNEIVDKGAAVYVCGDAKGLGAGVWEAFVEMVEKWTGRNREESEVFMKEMRTTKRYCEDIWS
eukprot:sb/3463510/